MTFGSVFGLLSQLGSLGSGGIKNKNKVLTGPKDTLQNVTEGFKNKPSSWKNTLGALSNIHGAFSGSPISRLLPMLDALGGETSKKEANLDTKDTKDKKKNNPIGEILKIAHHRDEGLPKLKGWQHRNLSTYDAMREGGMMNKSDYEKNLNRHKIPRAHWYGGIG